MKTMKNFKRRAIALLLAVLMCLSMMNLTVFAEETTEDEVTEPVYICGLEEHTHNDDECYEKQIVKELVCDNKDEDHEHTDECYAPVLDCGLEEGEGAHTHGDDCFATESKTVEEKVLKCELEESDPSEGHTHTDDCYKTTEPICGLEESEATEDTEGHTHTDDCYKSEVPVCGQEESEASEGHTHTEECYTTESKTVEKKTLTCELAESEGHEHSDACYKTEDVLVCELDEHTHTPACYAVVKEFIDKVNELPGTLPEEMPQDEYDALMADLEALLALYEKVQDVPDVDEYEAFTTAFGKVSELWEASEGVTPVTLGDGTLAFNPTDAASQDNGVYTISKDCTVTVSGTVNARLVITGGNVNITGTGTINAGGKWTPNTETHEITIGTSVGSVITITDGNVTLDGPTITGGTGNYYYDSGISLNSETSGGGVRVEKGYFTMTSGTISDNIASRGGGIYVGMGANLEITGGTVKSNLAYGTSRSGAAANFGGGGMWINGKASIKPTNGISITENISWATCDLGGGGIYVNSNYGSLELINAVITANSAAGLGGGLASCVDSSVALVDVQGAAIYSNTASKGVTLTSASGNATDGNPAWNADENFKENATDVLCASREKFYVGSNEKKHGTVISNSRFDGQRHDWKGYVYESDNNDDSHSQGTIHTTWFKTPAVEISAAKNNNGVIHGDYALGLKALNETAVAYEGPVVMISNNSSASHGGGVACNGTLFLGPKQTKVIKGLAGNLELTVSKTVVDANGQADASQSKAGYEFERLNSLSTTESATPVVTDDNGKATISYKDKVGSLDSLNEGPLATIYVKEKEGNRNGIKYDDTVYKVDLNVELESTNVTIENSIEVTMKKYKVTPTVTKGKFVTNADGSLSVVNGAYVWEPDTADDTGSTTDTLSFTNTKLNEFGEGTFTFNKVGHIPGVETNAPLAGAQFKLTKVGSPDKTAISDAHGVVKFDLTLADVGVWTLSETNAPADYDAVTTKWTVNVTKGGVKETNGDSVTYNMVATVSGVNGELTVVNEWKTGSLTIDKTVVSTTPLMPGEEFIFEVTLENGENKGIKLPTTLTDTNGKTYEVKDGKFEVTIAGSALVNDHAFVTIKDIPHGLTYTVTETSVEKWKVEGLTDTTGTIGTSDTKVEIRDTRLTGALSITKKVEGLADNLKDVPHTFKFTVTAQNDLVDEVKGQTFYADPDPVPTESYTPEEVKFNDQGVATVEIKVTGNKSETKTIKGLPTGTYTVTEETPTGEVHYTCSSSGSVKVEVEQGTTPAKAEITNTYSRKNPTDVTLRIVKKLDGPASSTNKFTFNIKGKTVYGEDVEKTLTVTGASFNEIALTKGTYTITEVKPENETGYTWDSVKFTSEDEGKRAEVSEDGASVTVNLTDADSAATLEVTATNTYTRDKGDLKIDKHVVNNTPLAADEVFKFEVTLTPVAGETLPKTLEVEYDDGKKDTVDVVDGKFTVTISGMELDNEYKGNKSVTIKGIPTGTTYKVDEVDAGKWIVTSENGEGTIVSAGNTAKITNTYRPTVNTTRLSVKKVWKGDGDIERPASVTVQLYRDGQASTRSDAVQTLNASNNWSYSWTGLNENYSWSVDEIDVPENYTREVTNTGTRFTITNTYTEPEIPEDPTPLTSLLSVSKVWVGDAGENRPASVSVQFYKDGERAETVTLNDANGWSWSRALSKEELASKWTVSEVEVPAGYTSVVTTGEDGISFTVTNTFTTTPEKPDEPETPDTPDEPKQPDTPDEPVEVPDEQPPLAEIPDEQPPLVDWPPLAEIPEEQPPLVEVPEEIPLIPAEPEVVVPEEPVPMVGIPQTGDFSMVWYAVAILSALGLVVLTLKKREDSKD